MIAFCKHEVRGCRHLRRVARRARCPSEFSTGAAWDDLEALGHTFGQPDCATKDTVISLARITVNSVDHRFRIVLEGASVKRTANE